jgi:hypothetical protein
MSRDEREGERKSINAMRHAAAAAGGEELVLHQYLSLLGVVDGVLFNTGMLPWSLCTLAATSGFRSRSTKST